MNASGVQASDLLATPLQFFKGVGPRRAADLERAGLHTIEDLLYRFPIRYEDRSRLQPIASLKPGQPASIIGRILSCGLRSTRRPGFKIFEAAVGDASGALRATWLNQPFLRDVFATGQHVVFYGMVEMRGHGGLQLTNPQYEILDDEDGQTVHTGRIVPVYEKTGTVTPKMQRRLVFDALQKLPSDLPEHLPEEIRVRLRLPTRYAALHATHFPPGRCSARPLEPVRDRRATATDFRRSVSLSDGGICATAFGSGGAKTEAGSRRRSHSRIGARGPAVSSDRWAEAGTQRNCRRPATGASHEPAVAG
jgi:ATP-dependent DNA helicase RecG